MTNENVEPRGLLAFLCDLVDRVRESCVGPRFGSMASKSHFRFEKASVSEREKTLIEYKNPTNVAFSVPLSLSVCEV